MSRKIWRKILIITLPLLFLLGAFKASAVFDTALTSGFNFLRGLSLFYYLAYYLIIGVLLYLGYFLISKGTNWKQSEFLVLSYLLLFGFVIYFPQLLFTNPLAIETLRYERVFYVLKYGTSEGMQGKPESPAPYVFTAIFTMISDLKLLGFSIYFIPIFLYLLTIFILYRTLRSFGSPKLALIGSLLPVISFFFHMDICRYCFALSLSMLFLATFLKYIFGKRRISVSLLLLVTFAALTLTHPALSLFAVIITVVYTLSSSVYTKIIKSRIHSFSHRKSANFCISIAVIWLYWFLFRFSSLPGFGRLQVAWRNVLQSLIPTVGVAEEAEVLREPLYSFTRLGRIFIGSFSLILPLFVFFTYIYLRKKEKSKLHLRLIGFGTAYFALFIAAILAGFNTLAAFIRVQEMAVLMGAILLVIVLNTFWREGERTLSKGRKFFKGILSFEIVASLIIVFLLWIPHLHYLQISSTNVRTVENVSTYMPENATVYTVGVQAVRFSPYGSRKDLIIRRWVSLTNLTAVKKEKIPKKGVIIIGGHRLGLEVKYQFFPPLHQRMKMLEARLVKNHYSKIYSNSDRYTIWIKN